MEVKNLRRFVFGSIACLLTKPFAPKLRPFRSITTATGKPTRLCIVGETAVARQQQYCSNHTFTYYKAEMDSKPYRGDNPATNRKRATGIFDRLDLNSPGRLTVIVSNLSQKSWKEISSRLCC